MQIKNKKAHSNSYELYIEIVIFLQTVHMDG